MSGEPTQTSQSSAKKSSVPARDPNNSGKIATDIFADLEATLDEVTDTNPRIAADTDSASGRVADLKALLEISIGINSSLVLEDVFQMVMHKAIELMKAERGLIMLLDDNGELQTKVAYNLCKEEMMEEDFSISSSITSQVARTGKAVYTSDALADERYAHQKSIVELHLRSIMCVPLTVNGQVIGVFYLDNSNQATMFLKSDLYLFELYAQLVSNALYNASMYNSLLSWEAYHKSVVTSSPVGIVVIDSKQRIVTMNPVALEIFDLDKSDIATIRDGDDPTMFTDIVPEQERPRWQKMINEVLITRREFSDSRYFHNTRYLEKALSIKISPISDLPDGGQGLTMAIEDVTEKVIMEKYVILSEKLVARGEMAASVAHELNNYLSIISNNAELIPINLQRGKTDKLQANARSVVDNVFKIKRFVDSLMDFAQPESEYVAYDIRHLIDDLLFSQRIQPRFKTIHFEVNLSDTIPNIEIDVGQIQQVLMNLLNNAADAITERIEKIPAETGDYKGQIGLTARWDEENDAVIIQISDNGIGMTEQVSAKVFSLHFSTKKGGHGLGLHNCKKIAEQHGGTLTHTSEYGRGTTFTLNLPRHKVSPDGNET